MKQKNILTFLLQTSAQSEHVNIFIVKISNSVHLVGSLII